MMAENSPFSHPPKDPLFALGRAILFEMDPEKAHDLALGMLNNRSIQRFLSSRYQAAPCNTAVLGQHFENRIGLAAGLDKNGDYVDALGALGFGHIEIGTVTPKPQAGNTRPRIFRLVQHEALINRLGFNNKGVDHLVAQVQRRTYKGRLGINIGKNATTSLDNAEDDYLYCLERVYAFADYVTVNISSPNTQSLRDLQHGERLKSLLESLKNAQSRLATEHERYIPIAVKLAPDMKDGELDDFCAQLIAFEIDALISSNTTNTREPVAHHLYARETGGLSGKPLRPLADDRLAAVHERIGDKIALFGVGGISCGNDALRKLQIGADLVQLYSGLIFQGPALVRDCIEASRSI
ncbi:MAG: quinone-dependent dihydroorotate dehydrogenase [Granulosicoccus sp.]